jgi:formamidopyrimidine-DNA glycosylase
MPEISEITLTSELIEYNFKNCFLSNVVILSGRYAKKSPKNYDKFIQNLPMTLKKMDNKGKFMWFEFQNKKSTWYVWNTFGLTGMWGTEEEKNSHFKFIFSINKDDEKEKKEKTLYYNDVRNFGTFNFSNSSEELEKKLKTLGIDYLKSNFTNDDFTTVFNKLQKSKSHNKKKIAVVLMNQKLLGSGIGNYLCAEILYHAKISPHKLIKEFTNENIETLYNSIRYIIKLSYLSNDTGYMQFLDKDLKNHKRKNYLSDIKLSKKDSFEFKVYGRKEDDEGNKVIGDKIVGSGKNMRTTYWVPDVQI